LDFLKFLFKHNDVVSAPTTPPLILVLDNKPLARGAFCSALEKVQVRGVGVDDPGIALKLLEHNSFDLVFSDLDMPGLNGSELCERIHALQPNQNTPVVFITALKYFETHAQSNLGDAADVIAKPFVLAELAVKTLPYILRRGPRRILASSDLPMAA
jgi:CheY-like chemotaxis protein